MQSTNYVATEQAGYEDELPSGTSPHTYRCLCEKILETIYPQELQDLFHTSDVELSDVASWFMRDAKVGEPAAKMFATTYIMLLQKEPEAAKKITKSKVKNI